METSVSHICLKTTTTVDKVLNKYIHFMKSILSDIFPNNNNDKCNNAMSPIHQAIYDACIAQNINATKYFVEKVYQLYEMLHIRPAIMVVGDSFSGKTTTYRVLAKALAILKEQQNRNDDDQQHKSMSGSKESHPVCCVINSKSVTIGQLYGGFDAKSHEWRDGILAINFKHFINANVECERRMWLIFDGCVDTGWMENINSVLDDNRKLCLTSGDIFYLNNSMNLLFEPMDLSDASPAIVKPIYFLYFLFVPFVFFFRFHFVPNSCFELFFRFHVVVSFICRHHRWAGSHCWNHGKTNYRKYLKM